MHFSRKEQWIIFASVNGVLLLVILLFPFYYKYVPNIPMSDCTMLEYLNVYCPACGGTRAFNALMHFDILGSIVYNPIVFICFLWLLAYEVTMIVYLIKKTARPVLIKPWMVYVTLGIWIAYTILRNVLLIWGIDLLGNVIPPM